MIKFLRLSLVAMLMTVCGNLFAQTESITLTFPDYNDKSVGSYTTAWTATVDGQAWTLDGFNNNNNGWAFVRCGRKNNDHTAILTSPATKFKADTYTVTVDKTSNLESVTFEILNGEDVITSKTITDFFAAGDVKLQFNNGAVGYSYRLTINSTAASANGTTQISKVVISGTAAEEPGEEPVEETVAAPEFSVAGGTYNEPQTITLSCATEGAEIYYTLDESEPTAESTLYTEPIALETTTTVKAVAIDAKGNASEVVSQKYVIYDIVKAQNIAFAKACDLNTPMELTLKNAVVLAVGNRYCVVMDATGALNLYGSNLEVAVGNRLNGVVKGTYTKYNGTPQIAAGADYSDITVTEGDEPEAALMDITEVGAEINTLMLVKIENAIVEKDGNNWYAVSGEDRIQIYDTFKANYTLEEGMVLESLTGIVIPFQKGNKGDITYEIAPRTEADIVVDQIATGISETMAQRQGADAIYTLDGRQVKTAAAKGIYIINGKKTVLR